MASKNLQSCIATILLGLAFSEALKADSLSFDTLYRSPYFLGRGDTGVAIADDQEAIFYNPAGLAQGQGIYKRALLVSPQLTSSSQTRDLVRQVLIQKQNDAETLRGFLGKNLHLGLSNFSGLIFRRAAIGALISTQTNVLLAKSAQDHGIESLDADLAANRILTFSLANGFWGEKLQIGTTFKYIQRNEAKLHLSALEASNVSEQLTADDVQKARRGFGWDLGLRWQNGKNPWRFGLHLENVGSTLLKSTEADTDPRRLAPILTAGAAYEISSRLDSMRFLIDFRDVNGQLEHNTFKRLHLGAELSIARFISLTGGLNQGYPTAGIGINLYVLRCDLGMYTQEIGSAVGVRPDQRFFLRVIAGL